MDHKNSASNQTYNTMERLILFSLPLLILSSHVLLALIFSAVFILSFLCLFLMSHIVKQENSNQFLLFGAKLLTLASINAIIQSVIVIIDPYFYTMYSMHISLIQFLPFIVALATQDKSWTNGTDTVIKAIVIPVISILFAFFREIITYGSIEFSVKNFQTLKPVTFYAGFSPWFAFLCIACTLLLIKVIITKIAKKRGSND